MTHSQNAHLLQCKLLNFVGSCTVHQELLCRWQEEEKEVLLPHLPLSGSTLQSSNAHFFFHRMTQD